MALVTIEADSRIRNVLGQPLTVRERHHPILLALPHRDRPLDLCEVEPPIAGESQVIVAPAGNAARDGPLEDGGQELGEIARQRCLIDVGDQASKRGRDIRSFDLAEDFRLLLEPGRERRFPFQRQVELLNILGAHPRHPVEASRCEWRYSGQRHGRGTPIRQVGGAGQSVGTPAGPADGHEFIDIKLAKDRLNVRDGVCY